MNEILQYFNDKGIVYKQEGAEIILKCPTCNKQKLSININSGKYQCWHCQATNPSAITAKGHFNKLQEIWGDIVPITTISNKIVEQEKEYKDFTDLAERYHLYLKDNKKARRYLLKRGFDADDIERFKFGYDQRYDLEWLVIPVFIEDTCKLLKLRQIPPEDLVKQAKYIREAGGESVLYNQDAVEKYDEIIICEGELDTITLIKNGYENAVGLTVGCGTLKPEWYDMLVEKERLILILDQDDAGQRNARNVWAKRLGIDKVWNVALPAGFDINEFFLKHTKEEFDEYLNNAYQFKVDGIMSLDDVFRDMYHTSLSDETIKYSLPWNSINKKIKGGIKRKQVFVIGGQPKTGKTSWALQVIYHFAKVHKIPSLFFCLEMPEVDIATKVVQLEFDLVDDEVNFSDALIYKEALKDLPMFFGYSPKITPEKFYNTMKLARNRYGVEMCVFDNLQLMVRSEKESDIAKASKVFKDMVMELDIMCILVSQPRKLNSEDIPTYDVLKGSGSIAADGDFITLMHRKRCKDAEGNRSFEPETHFVIDGARHASGGRTILYFDGAKSKFLEIWSEKGDKK